MTSQAPSALDDFLNRVVGSSKNEEQSPWLRRFGLRGNPFPASAQPIWEVFHNQKPVRDRFVEVLHDFVDPTAVKNTRTLLFSGGNRVGKTHFMEHHRRFVLPRFAQRGLLVPTALVSAEGCDQTSFLRTVLDQIEDSYRGLSGKALFQERPSDAVINALPAGSLHNALQKWVPGDEAHGELIRRWYRGERIRLSLRKALGVNVLLDSFAPLASALVAVLAYLRAVHNAEPRCPGVVVFVDELERVFHARRDRRGVFLQALRSLLDACADTGGLLMCVGIGVDVGPTLTNVEDEYPALYDRLKGGRDVPALTQVAGVIDARDYAREFINHARAQGAKVREELFDDREIEQLFRRAGGGASVRQGIFFDVLHTEAERKIAMS